MNSTTWKTRAWGSHRLIGLSLLVAGIFALAIGTREKAATTPGAASRDGAATDAVWKKRPIVESSPHGNSAAIVVDQAGPLRLEGRFSSANEPELIEQLTQAGYFYLASYRLNPDGSATIMGMRAQRAAQPLVTIRFDKDGRATVD